jgi:hypothetical protein
LVGRSPTIFSPARTETSARAPLPPSETIGHPSLGGRPAKSSAWMVTFARPTDERSRARSAGDLVVSQSDTIAVGDGSSADEPPSLCRTTVAVPPWMVTLRAPELGDVQPLPQQRRHHTPLAVGRLRAAPR